MKAFAPSIALAVVFAGCARTPVPLVEVAGDERIPGLVEVELRGTPPADLPGEALDAEPVEDPLWGGAWERETDVELKVDPAREDGILASLRARPDVVFAEPVSRVQAFWIPDDPGFAQQWHLRAAGAPRAWDASRGEGVTVAVIDTGIAPLDDLDAERLLPGLDLVNGSGPGLDDHGHGTHVAGTIAQSTGNGRGVAGMAPAARLLPVKVLAASGAGTSHGIARGIRGAALRGARVLNLSLGGPVRSLEVEAAVAFARRRGAVVVAAAGNGGAAGVSYPAAFAGALAVSAVGPGGDPAPYTSWGPEVALAAPGGDKSRGEEGGVLQQTLADDRRTPSYRFFQGTSMAAPHVSGAAALLVSLGVTDPGAVARLLRDTARAAPPGAKDKLGAGTLDAAAAVRSATLGFGLWRVALGLLGAFFALAHARSRGRLRAGSTPGPWFWGALLVAAGASSLVAPWAAERVGSLSFLALPPQAIAQRFAGLPGTSAAATAAAWLGWSALLPFALAFAARGPRPLESAFSRIAAGCAFGWAGALLHAAIARTVFLPGLGVLAPAWLAASAVVAWSAGRALFEREALR